MVDTKERILNGALRAFAEHGIRRARMHHVCAEAGCTRATAYRHFAVKDALIAAYAQWQLERQLASARQHLEDGPETDVRERIVEVVLFASNTLIHDPGLTPFFAPDAVGIMSVIPARNPKMMETIFGFVQWLIATSTAQHELRQDLRWDWAAEWMMRIVLSLTTLPGPERSREDERKFLEQILLPMISRAGQTRFPKP